MSMPLDRRAQKAASVNAASADARHVSKLGGCINPIRLTGRLMQLDQSGTARQLDAKAVYVACKNRRASVCEPCSRTYQGDAYQLIVAGLRGGKGVPESVSQLPALFVTLTAPSFGIVHGGGDHCMPRRDAGNCVHGRSRACWLRHSKGNAMIGTPLCQDCFDYEHNALWNASVTELWRRTRLAIDRGIDNKQRRSLVQYVKVAEFQRRGAIHLHVVIRYDAAVCNAHDLECVVRHAVGSTSTVIGNRHMRWGTQVDIRRVGGTTSSEADSTLSRGQIAGYLAKYATKDVGMMGSLSHRVTLADVDSLRASAHIRQLVRTCIELAPQHRASGPSGTDLRLDAWAHQLGFRGHFLTKSRNWSTTFTALRLARKLHSQQLVHDSWAALSANARDRIIARWDYAGRGYHTTAERLHAELQRQHSARAA